MTHINQRRDTAAAWTAANPTLQEGEVGWETDTRKSKLGDGVTAWTGLPYTTADIAVTKADIGLGQVDNTSDMDKPISTAAGQALALKAPLQSPAFTGSPTAPTPGSSSSSTRIATTEFVQNLVDGLVGDATSGQFRIGTTLVQWGSVSISLSSQSSKTQDITFPTAFSGTPYAGWTSLRTSETQKLISGFATGSSASWNRTTATVAVRTGDGTNSSAGPTLSWLVIGPA